jgi:hypothetical protein
MAVNDLAGGGDLGSQSVEQLFAGEAPILTESRSVKSGEGVCSKYQVMSLEVASGLLVKYDAAVTDGTEVPYGILAQPVDATSAAQNGQAYIGGHFNHAALVWPGGITTFAARRAIFATHHAIIIGKLK